MNVAQNFNLLHVKIHAGDDCTLFVAAVLQSVLLIRRGTRQHLTEQRCYCSTSSQSGRDLSLIHI